MKNNMKNSIKADDNFKRFRMYKSKKRWMVAGMTLMAGAALSTTDASANTLAKATGYFEVTSTTSANVANQVVETSENQAEITIVPKESSENVTTSNVAKTEVAEQVNQAQTLTSNENNQSVSISPINTKTVDFVEGNELAADLQALNSAADVYVNDTEKKTAVVMGLSVVPSDDDFISKMSEIATDYGYQAEIYLEAPVIKTEAEDQDQIVNNDETTPASREGNQVNADDLLNEATRNDMWKFGGYAWWRTPGTGNDSTTNFLLNKYTESKNGKAILSQQLDMTQSIHMSAWEYTNEWKHLLSFTKNSGDALGIFLTPQTPDIAALPNGAGEFLGIAGLADSVFLGRDLFPNKSDSYKNQNRDAVVIRATNWQGILQQPDSNAQGWMKRPGGEYSYKNGAGEEGVTFDWTPLEVRENGKVYGTLTYTLADNKRPGAKGNSVTVTASMELDARMSFGIISSNGSNAGHMEFDLGRGENGNASDFQATFAAK